MQVRSMRDPVLDRVDLADGAVVVSRRPELAVRELEPGARYGIAVEHMTVPRVDPQHPRAGDAQPQRPRPVRNRADHLAGQGEPAGDARTPLVDAQDVGAAVLGDPH